MNVQSAMHRLQTAQSTHVALSGAERRELTTTIVTLLQTFGPLVVSVARDIHASERCYAGATGWIRSSSSRRGFLALRDDNCEGHARPHSWAGVEVWATDGELLEARVSGSYNGLQNAGDLIEEECRTFHKIGVREVTRRYGMRFVRSFVQRIDTAAADLDRSSAEMSANLERLARVQMALK